MLAKERLKVCGVMVQGKFNSLLFLAKYFQIAIRVIDFHLSLLESDLAFLAI
jgi:hypothetical protein